MTLIFILGCLGLIVGTVALALIGLMIVVLGQSAGTLEEGDDCRG